MSDLKFLVKTRGHLRSQITRLHTKVSAGVDDVSSVSMGTDLANLEQIGSEVKTLNREIIKKLWDSDLTEEDLNSELVTCDEYTQSLLESITILKSSLSVGSANSRQTIIERSANSIKLKLPEVPLPFYSHGKGECLTRFLSSFETVTDKYNLSSYERFIFLKRQLKGEPLILINSLEEAKQSYQGARDLLEEAFAGEVQQKLDVIKRLSELRLSSEGSAYEFVGEMRTLSDLFATLKIGVRDIFQYFVWRGLTDSLQSHLVNICNNNKPSFEDINGCIFKAIERQKEVSDRKCPKKDGQPKSKFSEVVNYAANVKYIPSRRSSPVRVQFCSLCSVKGVSKEITHSTRDCPIYKTAEAKVKKLTNLMACTLCGYSNHTTKNCTFKFNQNCNHCRGLHMSFLCVRKGVTSGYQNSDNSAKNVKPKISSGTVWTGSVMQDRVGSEAILPTFTCSIGGTSNIRCMKDSGCQPHFLETRVADELNLPIVRDNFQVTVNGFNEAHNYLTKIVRVKISLGGRIREIEAICVPKIKTKLVLPGLREIVNEFKAKGYKLADELLARQSSDEISDIKLVLGTNDPDVLMENHVSFGGYPPSVYSSTHAGVLLLGGTARIIENLPYLLPAEIEIGSPDSVNVVVADIADATESMSEQSSEITIVPGNGGGSDSVSEVFTMVSSGGGEPHPLIEEVSLESSGEQSIPVLAIIDTDGELNEEELLKATDEVLQDQCNRSLHYDLGRYPEESIEVNDKLVKFALNNCSRAEDGRLIMPLLWRGEVSHLLGNNFSLSKKILLSTLRKFGNNLSKLKLIDSVFSEQKSDGVIERIEDVNSFLGENPNHSFLPHMGVFKLDRATTKCRVVYLSNLSETGGVGPSLSHNQAMHSGPSLNSKITTAVTQLRFGEKLLCFDLQRAFLQISLSKVDSNRLLFLWFKDVCNNNFDIVVYRSLRLSFGLRCSPTLLMLAMYKILCIDSRNDFDELRILKERLYSLMYMDNGAYTGDADQIRWAHDRLESVFSPYGFKLQQLVTNCDEVQQEIERKTGETTPDHVKLLGLIWSRSNDTLSARKIQLELTANTKRLVLKSISAQYDVFNFQGPCLNRARLFMHELQCDKDLAWDDVLNESLVREWKNIALQANSAPMTSVPRFVGNRDDPYKLIAFCDASKNIYAAVVYIKNLRTNAVNFVAAKNRIVNKQLEVKSIPTLELQAITLGVQLLMDTYLELCGDKCLFPVSMKEMQLFSDSMISLHWINAYSHKMDKMQKRSVFVMNRLEYIVTQCGLFPVIFSFVATNSNPADCLSRPLSHRQLEKSNYLTGPNFLRGDTGVTILDVVVPNPSARCEADSLDGVSDMVASVESESDGEKSHLIPLDRFSSFKKLVSVQMNVMKFVNILKSRLKLTNAVKYCHLVCSDESELHGMACHKIIYTDQLIHYADIFRFLKSGVGIMEDCSPLVSKLNLFIHDNLLKVKSKFERWKENPNFSFPVLLSKNSLLTKIIIHDVHLRMAHSGCYSMLTYLRKKFWIEHFFSTVKRVIKECVHCRRVNGRNIKLNQSSYRDWRLSPNPEPYSFLFLDYLGPFTVIQGGSRVKVWLLCLTCLWSRAVNLKLCSDLSVKGFLRAFQMHVFEQGLPSRVFSDLGSQIVVGGNIISDFLKDVDTQTFLLENGVKFLGFEQYFKGNSSLGSLVEVCVKFTKRLVFGSIRNTVLNYPDFELLVSQTIYLVNSRPVAFREGLRENDDIEVPAPITPELLIKGREITVTNVIPALQPDPDDPEWQLNLGSRNSLRREFTKLRSVREKLIKSYNEEFINQLMNQAVDVRNRYKKVNHTKLRVGDVILLKEPHFKSSQFPLAVVKKVITNAIGEVTDVIARKGKTSEEVKRHSTSVIKLYSSTSDAAGECEQRMENSVGVPRRGPPRRCRANN